MPTSTYKEVRVLSIWDIKNKKLEQDLQELTAIVHKHLQTDVWHIHNKENEGDDPSYGLEAAQVYVDCTKDRNKFSVNRKLLWIVHCCISFGLAKELITGYVESLKSVGWNPETCDLVYVLDANQTQDEVVESCTLLKSLFRATDAFAIAIANHPRDENPLTALLARAIRTIRQRPKRRRAVDPAKLRAAIERSLRASGEGWELSPLSPADTQPPPPPASNPQNDDNVRVEVGGEDDISSAVGGEDEGGVAGADSQREAPETVPRATVPRVPTLRGPPPSSPPYELGCVYGRVGPDPAKGRYGGINLFSIGFQDKDLEIFAEQVAELADVVDGDYYGDAQAYWVPGDLSGDVSDIIRETIGEMMARQTQDKDWLTIVHVCAHGIAWSDGLWISGHQNQDGHQSAHWDPIQQDLAARAMGDIVFLIDTCHAAHFRIQPTTGQTKQEVLAATASGSESAQFTSAVARSFSTRAGKPGSFRLQDVATDIIRMNLEVQDSVTGRKYYERPVFMNLRDRPQPENILIQPCWLQLWSRADRSICRRVVPTLQEGSVLVVVHGDFQDAAEGEMGMQWVTAELTVPLSDVLQWWRERLDEDRGAAKITLHHAGECPSLSTMVGDLERTHAGAVVVEILSDD